MSGSNRRGNAVPAITPNWRSPHNIRRSAPPADPASPARPRPALRSRQTVPSGHRREPGRWNPPRSHRISPPPAATRLQAPPSWAHWPCRARRDLKRRRGSQVLSWYARAINGYSSIWFPVTLSTNWNQIQAATRGTRRNQYKKNLCVQLHAATGQKHFRIQRRGNDLVGIMVVPQFRHRSDARATRGRRWVGRNGRPRPAHAGPRKTRARQDRA